MTITSKVVTHNAPFTTVDSLYACEIDDWWERDLRQGQGAAHDEIGEFVWQNQPTVRGTAAVPQVVLGKTGPCLPCLRNCSLSSGGKGQDMSRAPAAVAAEHHDEQTAAKARISGSSRWCRMLRRRSIGKSDQLYFIQGSAIVKKLHVMCLQRIASEQII